jgi:hypothetical protein
MELLLLLTFFLRVLRSSTRPPTYNKLRSKVRERRREIQNMSDEASATVFPVMANKPSDKAAIDSGDSKAEDYLSGENPKERGLSVDGTALGVQLEDKEKEDHSSEASAEHDSPPLGNCNPR